MVQFLAVLCCIQFHIWIAMATSDGALEAACPDLRPHHRGTQTETSPSPFVVLVSKSSYTAGEQIEVTLEALCDEFFLGFLLQARRADPLLDTSEYIGKFTPITDTHSICSNPDGVKRGLTHSTAVKREIVKVLWTAPTPTVGHIIFKATFVKSYSGYWQGVTSAVVQDPTAPPLSVNESSLATPTKTCPTLSSPATTIEISPESSQTIPATSFESTTASSAILQPSPGVLTKDSECQVTLGCFDDCDTGCTFTVNWKEVGDSIYFRLRSVSGGNSWMAIGFSDDMTMGNDSVTSCISLQGQVKVYQTFNKGHANTRLGDPEVGISEPKSSFSNGLFECSFFRQTSVPGNFQIFDLEDDWHVMYSHGTALPGFWMMPHAKGNHFITDSIIDFQTIDQIPVTTVKSTSSSKLSHSIKCGKSEGCFDDCSKGCTFTVTWSKEGDNIRFRLKSYLPDNSWMAVGFSKDTTMGDDSVAECVVYNGVLKAFRSHNNGFDNTRPANPTDGISDVTGGVRDGIFECSFLREISLADDSNSFSLSQELYLFFAHGKANSDFTKQPHIVYPKVTSAMVDFRRFESVAGGKTTPILVKVHGCLMCTAWLLFASIGLILARYFKPMWPDSTIGGVKIWFQMHRMCMTLTFLLTAAAFVTIFIESQGYSQILGETYMKSHPILGIIVTALVIINPAMAYFRPGPKAERRPIFNWAHFLVGTGAYVLAIIAIFFGMELNKAGAPSYMIYILAGYVAWQLLVEFSLEVLECCSKQKESRSFDDIQMQNPSLKEKTTQLPTTPNVHFVSTKQLLLGLHICVVTGVTVTVIVLLLDA